MEHQRKDLERILSVLETFLELESEEHQEGHHETEQSHGLGQSEAEDCVSEKLLLHRRISCTAGNESGKDGSNADACGNRGGKRISFEDVEEQKFSVDYITHIARNLIGGGI